MFIDGLFSSVVTPLTVAAQINFLEKNVPRTDNEGKELMQGPLQPRDLVEVMERPEFNDILLHLTKGPNGFLGSHSSDLHIDYPGFFNFPYPASSAPEDDRLPFKRAYKIKDGKVIGLSDDYHIAAHLRRRMSKSEFHRAEYKGHVDSSGCPVRHSFEDPETSKIQEPLVITAKKFLIAALETNQVPPEQ